MSNTRWSLIVPAYNEQEYLPVTLVMLKKAMRELDGGTELIVVDNNSTDATATIARQAGARVVFEPKNNIARARNAGAAAARGDILVFLDADTHMMPIHLRQVARSMADPRCGGGGFLMRPDRPINAEFRRALRMWNTIAVVTGMQAGCCQFLRREIFARTGGYPEHLYAGEDAACSWNWARWCGRHGLRTVFLRSPPLPFNCRKVKWIDWRTKLKFLAVLLLGPLALRSRRICSFWYQRPWQERPS